MTQFEIGTEVIGTRGSQLGNRGVIKSIIPDDIYEVYFVGIGQYTVTKQAIMPVSEFKALRDLYQQAQERIAELEAVCREVVGAFEISGVKEPECETVFMTIPILTSPLASFGKTHEVIIGMDDAPHSKQYTALCHLLDSLPPTDVS